MHCIHIENGSHFQYHMCFLKHSVFGSFSIDTFLFQFSEVKIDRKLIT